MHWTLQQMLASWPAINKAREVVGQGSWSHIWTMHSLSFGRNFALFISAFLENPEADKVLAKF